MEPWPFATLTEDGVTVFLHADLGMAAARPNHRMEPTREVLCGHVAAARGSFGNVSQTTNAGAYLACISQASAWTP